MRRLPRGVRDRIAILVWAWGVLAWSATSAVADGVIRDGLGAISSGRGGTNIAHSDNGEVLLDNPAGIVNIEGTRLSELSFDLLFTHLHFLDPQNDASASANPFPLGQFSYIAKSSDEQWAFGLGAYAPAGFGATFDLNGPPLVPGVHRYKSLGALGKIVPGVAYRLNDRLSIGATLGVGVSHAELEGPFFVQTGPLSGTPTLLDLQGSGASLVWSVGLQHDLTERTTWGLTYTSESRFRLDGNALVDVAGLQSRYDATIDITWPRSVGFGVKHLLCEHRRASLDVIWFGWSDAFDSIGLRLANGNNVLLPPAFSDQFPLDWRDSVSVRLGYEEFLTPSAVLRAGYVYHPDPIPDATLTPYIPAILEHAFSVGCGKRSEIGSVDLAYQFSFGPDRRVGTSGLVGGDFDNSTIRAQAHWLFLSFSRQH